LTRRLRPPLSLPSRASMAALGTGVFHLHEAKPRKRPFRGP
jgi:hypothetical protein